MTHVVPTNGDDEWCEKLGTKPWEQLRGEGEKSMFRCMCLFLKYLSLNRGPPAPCHHCIIFLADPAPLGINSLCQHDLSGCVLG